MSGFLSLFFITPLLRPICPLRKILAQLAFLDREPKKQNVLPWRIDSPDRGYRHLSYHFGF
jgi:hypothetical protein